MTPIHRIDRTLRALLLVVACALLTAMVLFTVYTIAMRYVFLSPPFWGDTLTMFANIWLVMIALALSVRDRSHIAMQALYTVLPARVSQSLEVIWTLAMLGIGVLLAWPGFEAAMNVPGAYWELNNLPKRVPMLILPLSGILVTLASLLVLAESFGWAREAPSSREVLETESDAAL